MPMGGDGPWAVGAMWAMTALVAIFVVLRLYTRIVVVKSYGMDDNVYIFAFICLVGYSAFVNVAATYGFGQNMAGIKNPRDISNAILNEAISQTFAVLGMAVAKWSMGLFLLRIIKSFWHQVAIWSVMCLLMGASISCIFCFWMQCTPYPYLWDRSIPGGYCDLPQLPISIILGTSCVFTDLFFATFPWIVMWRLQINPKEKLVILASMSLGVIAAGFGIKRATEIPELMSSNYLKDTVGIIVWSAAEMAVTMVCIGIPVCRPLYKKQLDKFLSIGEEKYKGSVGIGGMFPLRTFGGSPMSRGAHSSRSTNPSSSKSKSGTTSTSRTLNDSGIDGMVAGDRNGRYFANDGKWDLEAGGSGSNDSEIDAKERKVAIRGPFTQAYAVGSGTRVVGDNNSEEQILGDEYVDDQFRYSDGDRDIHVTDEYSVTVSDSRLGRAI